MAMWYGGALVNWRNSYRQPRLMRVCRADDNVFSRQQKNMKICKHFPTNCVNLSSEMIYSVYFSNITLVEIYKPRNSTC